MPTGYQAKTTDFVDLSAADSFSLAPCLGRSLQANDLVMGIMRQSKDRGIMKLFD